MARKGTKKAISFKVYHFEGKHWTPIHSDKEHAWVMPFNMTRKVVAGISKKVDLSFLESQEFVILAK